MKKLLAILLLLCSLSVWADATQDWNKRFSELNSVPLNVKWTPSGQQAYLRQLMTSKPDYFKNPDDYRLPVVSIPTKPYVAPVVTQEPMSIDKALASARETVRQLEAINIGQAK